MPILRNSKSRENQHGFFWEYIKNTWRKKGQRGAARGPQAWLPRPTPLAAATGLVGTLVAHWPPLLLYEGFRPEKNQGGAFSWILCHHEAAPEQTHS